jgi:acyl transferase domain-containing protein/acyl-CoA synthetase (AMP-forming)/AMP-acid ligase II/acyl carrier protein/short-subunit dehydrogenase involved in D-alanine esterification of teichoic acids
MQTFVDVLESRAHAQPEKVIFEFLPKGVLGEKISVTYRELALRARSFGAWLMERNATGERILLQCRPSPDFIAAFLGCLYGGAIAVPSVPAASRRGAAKVRALAKDAGARVLFVDRDPAGNSVEIDRELAGLERVSWADIDSAAAATWKMPSIGDDHLAFLQYTSGTTSAPRGVMVSHANLWENQCQIRSAMAHDELSSFVSWLPPFHDMGLIGGLLQPLFLDSFCAFMPSLAFIRDPHCWLAAISAYGAHTSGAPNFAYQLCCDEISDEQAAALDLSRWRVAFNGSEPVSARVIENFSRKFAAARFAKEAFFPCYGLAEATLIVSGSGKSERPGVLHVDREALLRHEVREVPAGGEGREVVSCGRVVVGCEVAVVEPETRQPVETGRVGEIWVRGGNVSRGYWEQPGWNEALFGRLTDDDAGREFLRTGDLGFLHAGQLHVTGRLKDVIIVRGRNHYPQDLELTATAAHPALQAGAAFLADGEKDDVILVLELKRAWLRKISFAKVSDAVRRAILAEHELAPSRIVLIKPSALPRTSSGKIQRQLCRRRFLDELLPVVAEGDAGEDALTACGPDALCDELCTIIQHGLEAGIARPSRKDSLARLGMDSLAVVRLQQAIQRTLGVDLELHQLLEAESIEAIARAIDVARSAARNGIVAGEAQVVASELIPLSPQQQAIYFVCRMDPAGTVYHLPIRLLLRGQVDESRVWDACEALVARHGLLRATVVADGDALSFRIGEGSGVDRRHLDLSQAVAGDVDRALIREMRVLFDLEHGPLARFLLVVLPGGDRCLSVVLHHIISDGWSLSQVLFPQFVELYGNLAEASAARALPEDDYREYARWLEGRLRSNAFDAQRDFWRRKLVKPLPRCGLFADVPEGSENSAAGEAIALDFRGEETAAIQEAARSAGVTTFVYLLTVFKVLVARCTGQTDLLVGTLLANRGVAKWDQIIGLLANPVAIRSDLSGDRAFAVLVQQVHAEVIQVLKNGDLPFEEVVREVQPDRRGLDSNLFQMLFVMQDQLPGEIAVAGVRIGSEMSFDWGASRYGLEVHLWICEGRIKGALVHRHSVISSKVARELARGFVELASRAGECFSLRLSELPVPGDRECGEMRRLEAESRKVDDVMDCVVTRRGPAHDRSLVVAHPVVARGADARGVSRRLKARFAARGVDDIRVVPLSRIPLTATGDVARGVIDGLAVLDGDCEEVLSREASGLIGGACEVRIESRTAERELVDLEGMLASMEGARMDNAAGVMPERKFAPRRNIAYAGGGEFTLPDDFPRTLTEAFFKTANEHPNRGLWIVRPDGESVVRLTYAELRERAMGVASSLQRMGFQPGHSAILQIDDLERYFPVFWGCVLRGVKPVTIAVAGDYSARNSVVKKLHGVWMTLHRPVIIAGENLVSRLEDLATDAEFEGVQICRVSAVEGGGDPDALLAAEPHDVAFYQLTSGSTGVPKCIQETHRSILAHVVASARFNGQNGDDIALNWLPLDHVVPILTYHLRDVVLGADQVQVPTGLVLANPLTWLDLVAKYRVTHSWSPNFGFKLVAEALAADGGNANWDLSCLKFLMNAGEQVTPAAVGDFLERTARFGVRPVMMQPAFGMAEVCTCMTYTNDFSIETAVRFFDPTSLGGDLCPVPADTARAAAFVDLGPPIPGVEIRITDSDNNVVREGVIGRLQIRGVVLTPGYYDNPEANRDAFVGDGWFNSGDLGFLWDGRLFVTGREKEQIVVQGVNYYCYEIESLVGEIDGVIPTFVAACAMEDPDMGTEALAVFFCSTREESDDLRRIVREIRRSLSTQMGISPRWVLPLPKGEFPKTTSGKIQRSSLKKRLASGAFLDLVKRFDAAGASATGVPRALCTPVWVRCERRDLPVGDGIADRGVIVFLDETAEVPAAEWESRFGAVVAVRQNPPGQTAEDVVRVIAEATLGSDSISKWTVIWVAPEPGEIANLETRRTFFQSRIAEPLVIAAQGVSRVASIVAFVMVTRWAFEVFEGEEGTFEVGGAAAFLRSWQQEGGPACHIIDFDFSPVDVIFRTVAREVSLPAADGEIAYRGGARFVRRLEFLDRVESASHALPARGATILVTGGFGGVGALVCETLLRTYRASLLLLGRTPMEGSAALARLREFGDVTCATVDLMESTAIAAAVKTYEESCRRPVQMVIHLAGIMQAGAVRAMAVADLGRHLDSKIGIAHALEAAFSGRPEVGFVYFSSVNGFFGGAAVGCYSLANAALEGFAAFQRRAMGRDVRCLAWSMWENVGMSAGHPAHCAVRALGYDVLEPARALKWMRLCLGFARPLVLIGLDETKLAIRRVLAAGEVSLQQLSVRAPGEIGALYLTDSVGRKVPAQSEAVPKTASEAALRTGAPAANGKSYATSLETTLRAIWKRYLKLSHVRSDQNFFEIGGSSLLLLQVQGALMRELGLQVTLVDLFRNPTIAQLVTSLSGRQEKPARKPGTSSAPSKNSDIAIIGMACRFPGSGSVREFWENLRAGRESLVNLTDEQMVSAGVPPELLRSCGYVPRAGLLREIDCFDSDFFGYSRREAGMIDPQQRLFLEASWEALEAAGYDPVSYPDRVGVFAGAGFNTHLHARQYDALLPSYDAFLRVVANEKDYLATRVSYKLNLRGPSVTVQTACSTSLAAIHLACQSLRLGECEMALAGAVTVRLPHEVGYLFQEGMIFSPDGRCRPFDASANGTVGTNGLGIVVLKPLAAAQADADLIWAVIKGTAWNNDGQTKVGYTAPSAEGQKRVIEAALANANVDASTVQYLEAHGTGTALGDPVEFDAIRRVFGKARRHPLFLGSVKANIGHTDSASGVAGLIKVACMLRARQMVPLVHYSTPNPGLELDETFQIPRELQAWTEASHPRRAGVSSFGVGGTNVHAVLEEAPPAAAGQAEEAPFLLVVSAKTGDALDRLLERYESFFDRDIDAMELDRICYTSQVGRSHWSHRAAVVAADSAGFRGALRDLRERRAGYVNHSLSEETAIAFFFDGENGAAAADAHASAFGYRQMLERCRQICRNLGREFEGEDGDARSSRLRGFIQQIALAQMWREWGVEPRDADGEGVGALVAACIREELSLEDALRCLLSGEAVPVTQRARARRWDRMTVVDFASLEPEASRGGRPTEGAERIPLFRAGLSAREALLHTVARVYEAGISIDWRKFHTGRRVTRTELPTYPFLREKCLPLVPDGQGTHGERLVTDLRRSETLELLSGRLSPVAAAHLPEILAALEEVTAGRQLFHRVDWQTLDQSETEKPLSLDEGKDSLWLIVGAAGADTEKAREWLLRRDLDVRLLTDDGSRNGGADVVARWREQLLSAAAGVDRRALRLIYFVAQEASMQDRFGESIVALVQAAAEAADKMPIKMHLMTREFWDAPRVASLAAATAWGLGKCLLWERPSMACEVMDIGSSPGDLEVGLGKLMESADSRRLWRVKDGKLLEPVILPFEPVRRVTLRSWEDGSYLITGGCGSLGLEVAEWLADQGVKEIFLAGRNSPGAEARARLEALERKGIACRTIRRDASVPAEVAAIFREDLPSASRPVRGIFHLAAQVVDATILNVTAEGHRQVMKAKAESARLLHLESLALDLDHFILFSSLTSVVGAPGQASYVAANLYLDSLALNRRAMGLPGMAIDWGAWKGVGLARRAVGGARPLGIRAMQTAEGRSAFRPAFESDASQALVCPFVASEITQLTERYSFLNGLLKNLKSESAKPIGPTFIKELMDAPPATRQSLLHERLRKEVAAVAGVNVEEIDDATGFTEMGLDSLMAIQLKNSLEALTEKSLSSALIYNYPNMIELEIHLREELQLDDGKSHQSGEGEVEALISKIAREFATEG